MSASSRQSALSTERWRMVGVVLWRGGLAFVAAYTFYLGSWRLIRMLDWPAQITVGLAVAAAGLGLVMISLILERIRAARSEGNLLDD